MNDDEIVVAVEAACLDGSAAVGRVIEVGPGAAHLADARVVVGAAQPCGDCDVCRRGGGAVCPVGRTIDARSPRLTARARWALALADGLDVPGPAAALIGGPAALAYAMYARTGVGPGDPTHVLGDGPVARLLAQILTAKGAPPSDPSTHGARPAKLFVCDPDAAPHAIALAGPRATVTVAAGARAVDVTAAIAREVTVIGVAGAHPDLLPEVAALVVRGDLTLDAADVIAP